MTRKGGRGKQEPPYEILVGQYLRAVMDGRPPAAVCRYKFGLTQSQWEDRRSHLGKTGWLPRGKPAREGQLQGRYHEAWLEVAFELYGAKLEAQAAAREARVVRSQQRDQQRDERRAVRAAAAERTQAEVRARQKALAQAKLAELSKLTFDVIG